MKCHICGKGWIRAKTLIAGVYFHKKCLFKKLREYHARGDETYLDTVKKEAEKPI